MGVECGGKLVEHGAYGCVVRHFAPSRSTADAGPIIARTGAARDGADPCSVNVPDLVGPEPFQPPEDRVDVLAGREADDAAGFQKVGMAAEERGDRLAHRPALSGQPDPDRAPGRPAPPMEQLAPPPQLLED